MELRSSIGGFLRRRWVLVGLGIVVVAAAVIAALVLSPDQKIKRDTYQLVTLTSGDSYIGKLQATSGQFLVLSDVYFKQKNSEDEAVSGVTVVRLSASVEKPEDIMYIASDKVLHWENLQRDSKIVQVIEQDTAK